MEEKKTLAQSTQEKPLGRQVLPSREDNTCPSCRAIAISGMGPSHNGSRLCRMRTSIASGGDRSHCTCAACF